MMSKQLTEREKAWKAQEPERRKKAKWLAEKIYESYGKHGVALEDVLLNLMNQGLMS